MWRFLRHTTRLLRHQGYYKQGYYIKVYQGYYVTMTLTNHRTFQNRPSLDAKKMHFCSSESRESRIFGISALKTIVLKNKTKLFSTCNWSIVICHSLKFWNFSREVYQRGGQKWWSQYWFSVTKYNFSKVQTAISFKIKRQSGVYAHH